MVLQNTLALGHVYIQSIFVENVEMIANYSRRILTIIQNNIFGVSLHSKHNAKKNRKLLILNQRKATL